MSQIKVSVIVPNYNHEKFLGQRIESVLKQTFQHFELVILDDASSDDSRQIIESYRGDPRVSHIIYNSANSGSPFAQWEMGIKLAKGEYVWIAESDDWAHPEFLEILIRSIDENENVGICFSDSNWIDVENNICDDLSIHKNSFVVTGQEEIRNSLMKFNSIQNASAALIKKSLALRFINKSVTYKATGDWLLYIQILRYSNLVFVGEKLNNFRWYHNNTSNKALANGTWIKEGMRLLVDSGSYALQFTRGEISQIKSYWLDKTRTFPSLQRRVLQFYIGFYFMLFNWKRFIFQT